MNLQNQSSGIKSGIARQTPKLIADKAKAIEMHKAGSDTGEISRAIPGRQRNEIRRWLLAAGIYRPIPTGQFNKGKRRFNAIAIIANQYAEDIRQAAKMDNCQHWRKHKAVALFITAKRNKANPEKRKAYLRRLYLKQPIAMTIRRRIAARIRKALFKYGGNSRKTMRTPDYIGCNIDHLRRHLESQFSIGMNWKNYGQWHIDHRKPCASFDLTNTDQQLACFHWSNLQPLWALDNIRKSDKLIA